MRMELSTRNLLIGAAVIAVVAAGAWQYFFPRDTSGIVWKNASRDMITLDLIKPGATVLPTFTVTGQARGTWYFEASFPAEVLDKDGNQLVIAPAQAQGEWMTEDFVPFSVELSVGKYSGPAVLVLRKDNPSGLPENDASVSIPIEIFDIN